MKLYTYTLKLCSVMLMSMFTASVIACDMHGMPGFGFGTMAKSHANGWQPPQDYKAPTSKLHTNSIKLIGVEEESEVSVTYKITEPFENATITARSDYKLQLIGDQTIDLSKAEGDVSFSISARQAGRYILYLELITLIDNKPQKVTKQVYVNARASS